MPLLQRLVNTIVGRPVAALAIATLAVLGLAWPAASVPTDNSLAVWFVEDDPALARYHEFLDTFGNDEAVVVAYRTGGAGSLGLDSAALALQERAAAALAEVDGVERVLHAAPLVRAAGQEAARPALERLGLAGTGDTGNATAIVAQLEPSRDMDARRGRILDDVGAVLDRTLVAAGHEVRLAGNGVLYEGLNRQTERDGAIFLALALLVMTVLLWLILGSLAAVLLTLAGPLAATAAVSGIVGWTGGSLNVVMATLPALILVVGIADGVHIFMAWYRGRREQENGVSRRALAAEVVGRMAVPCLFTSLTTALAFLALTSSRMAVIRDLGLYAAAGMLLVWALVIVVLAAGLVLVDIRPPARAPGARLAGHLAALGGWLGRRRGVVLGGFAAAAVALAVGASRVVVDTHTLGLLPDDHPVVEDSRWIESNLGAYTPLEFVIRAREGTVLEPEVLDRIARWQARAESDPAVARTLGLTDLFALAGDRVPSSAAAADRALIDLAALMDDDLTAYLTPDRTATRVTAFVPMGTARDFAGAVARLREAAGSTLGDRAAIEATGYLPLYVRIIDYTVSSTLLGLALAFAGVFLVLAVLLRSWRSVLAAVPPNVFAVLTVFGVMGWARIPLDIATATVGAIVLGIAVDDTVHFLHRFRRGILAGETATSAASRALTRAGPAMVLTSVVLVLGLGVLMAAWSVSIVYFGLLISLAVAAAVVADLLLLPVLLPLLHPRTETP